MTVLHQRIPSITGLQTQQIWQSRRVFSGQPEWPSKLLETKDGLKHPWIVTAAAPDPETGREKTVEADEDRWVHVTKLLFFTFFYIVSPLRELSIGEINQPTDLFLEHNPNHMFLLLGWCMALFILSGGGGRGRHLKFKAESWAHEGSDDVISLVCRCF